MSAPVRFLATVLVLFPLWGIVSPFSAQSPTVLEAPQAEAGKRGDALEAAGIRSADVEGLISTLEDPAARDKLVTQLRALRALDPAVGAAAEKPLSRVGGRIIETLSEKIDNVSGELVGGAELLLDAPRIVAWVKRQA